MINKKKAASIKYLKEKLDVPVISAYGVDEFAEKIINEAVKNGIEIVKNEEFFKHEKLFDIDAEIPEEVYKIVADIIACIIKTNKRGL
ncbi:MAG: EscU/YscU/HrcU family type III secretion system export apparatus switch protein [Spirochaetes bacterium]|nr:EscU/YscU/HrcU family type III secretion system export apparatus switch protein [Spirochaetota bacterium]